MLVYGSSCYDQIFSDMCNLNQTIKSVPLGFPCEADENNFMWLFQSCKESSTTCFNNFNECAQAQETKHDSIGNLEWENIVLVQDLNLKPTISNLSQETTIIISSSTTTNSITLPPKTESQNQENVWKTECVTENCKEAMEFAEENGNSSNGLKYYYSFITFLGITFIKFLIRFL
uniref:Uncharacterized protein n=1 Tax=Panagrolaimus davidi TaxID=227884 RepID=A0A914QLY0_9BILA